MFSGIWHPTKEACKLVAVYARPQGEQARLVAPHNIGIHRIALTVLLTYINRAADKHQIQGVYRLLDCYDNQIIC